MSANPVFRILKKDLRKQWLLLVAATALGLFASFAGWSGGAWLLPSQGRLLDAAIGLRWFLIALITIAVVQDDSVSGDRAAWLVRPISPSQVLLAKLVLIWGGLALPSVLMALVAGGFLHSGVAMTAMAAFFLGGWVGVGAMGLALLASFTTSLLRTASVAIACVLVVAVGTLLNEHFLHAWMVRAWPPAPLPMGEFPLGAASGETLQGVAILALFLAAAFSLFYQYRIRRFGRTLGLVGGLLVGGALVLVSWRWDFFPDRSRFVLGPQGLTYEADDPHGLLAMVVHGVDRPIVALQMKRTGGPAGAHFDVFRTQSRFTSEREGSYTMPFLCAYGSVAVRDGVAGDAPDPAVFEVLGAPSQPPAAELMSVGVLELPRPVYDSLRGASGRLETDLLVEESKLAIVARLPLMPGEKAIVGGRSWRIRSFRLMSDGYAGVVIESNELVFDETRNATFALVNRATGEVSPAASNNRGATLVTELLVSKRYETIFHVRHSPSSLAKADGIDADWMGNADLVVLGSQFLGLTKAKFEMNGMVMPDTPAAR